MHTTADKVMKKLELLNLSDKVYDGYEFYHIEALDNAFMDIDKLIVSSGGTLEFN